MEGNDNREREEIYSRAVRAGKRTYFFDVKTTRRGDYYLTITESKKRFDRDGNFRFEKHKVFLYKEDFDKFTEGLEDVVNYIKEAKIELIDDVKEESAKPRASVAEADTTEVTEDNTEVKDTSTDAEIAADPPATEVTEPSAEKTDDEPADKKDEESLEDTEADKFTDVEFEDLGDKKE